MGQNWASAAGAQETFIPELGSQTLGSLHSDGTQIRFLNQWYATGFLLGTGAPHSTAESPPVPPPRQKPPGHARRRPGQSLGRRRGLKRLAPSCINSGLFEVALDCTP
jgi:hypothetical protein